MRETSLEAWGAIERNLPEKRVRVLNHIAHRPEGMTLFELVRAIGRPVNEISGRVTELSKAKYIIENGRRENPDTLKSATVWILNPDLKDIIKEILTKEKK